MSLLAGMKYLPAAILFVLFWQFSALANNLLQIFWQQEERLYALYTPPEYKEDFLGEAGWSWSNYKNLYGKIETNAAPTINLAVTLLGILNLGDRGFAMMKVGKGAEKLYGLGDNVQGRIKLSEIGLDSITLSDGATTKTYSLVKEKTNIFLQRLDAPKTSLITTNPKVPSIRNRVSVSALSSNNRQRIVDFERKIRENPLVAANDFDAKAVSKNGRIYGYQVQYKVDPAILRSLGLLPTDIIISVNDIPAATIANNREIMANLANEKNFAIIYERSGVINTLNLNR